MEEKKKRFNLKFAHIADTHIKNLKYHYEYRIVFEKMYKILREEQVDCIVHCGDLAHTKTQLSPEYFEMATNFLRSLADIAPTYVIPGNHDGNLRNSSRQDAITPIMDALNHPNLHLLKDSGEVALNDDFTLNVLSVFDTDKWAQPSDYNKVNIALHHGSISGCKTDLNWIMEYGENDITIFEGHDFAFLGDIHKTDQILDDGGRIRYCGSTVQQNHGETNDKGFLIWDIEDKDTFTVKHVVLENPKPFITINLTPKGRIPKKANPPEGARLRIASNNNIPLDALRRAVDVAKTKFKPESITFLNRQAGVRGSVENLTKAFKKEDLRDTAIQEKFIKEYLKDYEPDEEVMTRVYDFNGRYNTVAEEEEEVARNIDWKLESIEWDNLFNYGEDNRIDFANLNGIVGIFGKNYSGKSSIVDSLLFTLYNSTSKRNRKNLHVINQTKEECVGKLKIRVDNKIYTIQRLAEKYEKRLHGKTTIEAKTDVEFSSIDEVTGDEVSLNGMTRNDTDKNIRKIFGTMDDFLLTSMASQVESLSFIKEGSTKRKEILAKFLDLEIFERKYRMAKEDASDLKGALRRLEERDFDTEVTGVKEALSANTEATREHKEACDTIKVELIDFNEDLAEIQAAINATPVQIIDINQVNKELIEKKENLIQCSKEILEYKAIIKQKQSTLGKIAEFLNNFDIDGIEEKREIIVEKRKELESIMNEIKLEQTKLKNSSKKVRLLEEVPCGSEYSHCKFIHDAYVAKEKVDIIGKLIDDLKEKDETLEKEIEVLDPKKVEEYISNYNQILKRQTTLNGDISRLAMSIEQNKTQQRLLEHEIESLKDKVVEYNENKELIENLENLLTSKQEIDEQVEQKSVILEECEQSLLELYKLNGSLEQQLGTLKNSKKELASLREAYAAYDLFMKCMHPNGIPYDIIKKKLPIINEEIAKILTNIVNFEIFFEADGNKLEIFIKHPRYEARPIELGSGAEKTIAAMAIRLALLGVSSLPKPDLFVLDEPGTALDEDNMEGFIRILDMVKSSFKTVLLISHLDSLKDCVDTTIDIERQGKFAYVNQ